MSRSNSPSKQLKRLFDKEGRDGQSLKDFAVDLHASGTQQQVDLVNTWLKNKSRGE